MTSTAAKDFKDLNIDPLALKSVLESGYQNPTPIQEKAIPEAIKGLDILGIAQTGTGKTASFTLPIITLLSKGRARARMPRSLVLCPTRELAIQVSENFSKYAKYTKLTQALLIGGTSFNDQDKAIDRGTDVLIATPGRLLDHFKRGKLLLNGVSILVIDEADRMLDMGFIPDIEKIIELTPFTRQTLFFSATLAPEIEKAAKKFLNSPVRIEVSKQSSVSQKIDQKVIFLEKTTKKNEQIYKRKLLRELLRAEYTSLKNCIIFCNRKNDVDKLLLSLKKHGFAAACLHGGLTQALRNEVLERFRAGDLKLLVASDVAARGLDIPLVSHVINFDVPTQSEDYVHRIGRTGRAGNEGKSFTICSDFEKPYLEKIEALIGKKISEEPVKASSSEKEKPTSNLKNEEPTRESSSKSKRTKKDNNLLENTILPKSSNTDEKRDQATNKPSFSQGEHVPSFLLEPVKT